MALPRFSSLSIGNLFKNKFILAGAVVATTTVVGGAGIAAAQSFHHFDFGHHHKDNPAIVRFCKEHYKDLGFKNVGQCVSSFQHNHGHGYGYGGKHHHHHHGHGNDNSQGNED